MRAIVGAGFTAALGSVAYYIGILDGTGTAAIGVLQTGLLEPCVAFSTLIQACTRAQAQARRGALSRPRVLPADRHARARSLCAPISMVLRARLRWPRTRLGAAPPLAPPARPPPHLRVWQRGRAAHRHRPVGTLRRERRRGATLRANVQLLVATDDVVGRSGPTPRHGRCRAPQKDRRRRAHRRRAAHGPRGGGAHAAHSAGVRESRGRGVGMHRAGAGRRGRGRAPAAPPRRRQART